jgi:hypothetical protein
MANRTNSFPVNGRPSNSFIPKNSSAELAALLPIPFDVFVNFNFESVSSFNIARADTPATFFRFLAASRHPQFESELSADFLMIISSPAVSKQSPKTSKPQERFAIVAGQNILFHS